MAAVIDATIGGENANSYCLLSEANTFHESRINSTTWDSATDDQKIRALVTATRLLDEHMDWEGTPTDEIQRLCWPRLATVDTEGYLYDHLGREIGSDEIPEKLKEAVAEFARLLLETDRTEDSTEGFSSVDVGPIGIGFSQGRPAERKVVPDAVYEMISQWGDRYYARSSTVSLERC